jgi:hypothetical protein
VAEVGTTHAQPNEKNKTKEIHPCFTERVVLFTRLGSSLRYRPFLAASNGGRDAVSPLSQSTAKEGFDRGSYSVYALQEEIETERKKSGNAAR